MFRDTGRAAADAIEAVLKRWSGANSVPISRFVALAADAKLLIFLRRRGARVVEWDGLEKRGLLSFWYFLILG
jgi:hypothetical protein